jgi:hypothetical protein
MKKSLVIAILICISRISFGQWNETTVDKTTQKQIQTFLADEISYLYEVGRDPIIEVKGDYVRVWITLNENDIDALHKILRKQVIKTIFRNVDNVNDVWTASSRKGITDVFGNTYQSRDTWQKEK